MKKIVKLTEYELKKVLKKIINESLLLESPADSFNRGKLESTYTKYFNMGKKITWIESTTTYYKYSAKLTDEQAKLFEEDEDKFYEEVDFC